MLFAFGNALVREKTSRILATSSFGYLKMQVISEQNSHYIVINTSKYQDPRTQVNPI